MSSWFPIPLYWGQNEEYFPVSTFLNYNSLCLIHFLTWKVGTKCGQISGKEEAPGAGGSQATWAGGWAVQVLGLWGCVGRCLITTCQGHVSWPPPAALALAFSQRSSLQEIVCLRVLGVQDKEEKYIFLHIFSVFARDLNIWSEVSFTPPLPTIIRGIFSLWVWRKMTQFEKNHEK